MSVEHLRDLLQTSLGVQAQVQGKLLASLGIILAAWLVRYLVLRVVFRKIDDPASRYRWRKSSATIAAFLGMLGIGRVWFAAVGSLATFLGLLSAGLAIALKDLLSDIAGWVFIVGRRPFVVGDRIQVGEVSGDVIDVRLFQFTLLEIGNWVDADQSTGRIVHVPNQKVFTEPQANYSQGFEYIWNELPVLVTFESNWRKAKGLLREIAQRHGEPVSAAAADAVKRAAQRFFIYYTTLTPTVYTTVKDSGVLLTIRHLCSVRSRRGISEVMWEEILDAFAACDDIDLAYPTRRFYDNVREGKPATRTEPD